MLLECPNPKDPQDAEVAKMMMEKPEQFAMMAHEWAVKHANAPRAVVNTDQYKSLANKAPPTVNYRGWHPELVNRFVNMGFEAEKVIEAFQFVGIDRNGGQDYVLEEAYMGDITAYLLGEP